MADVIDAFVATLGLDARQYNDEIKKFRKDQKDLRDQAAKDSKESDRAQKQVAAGYRTIRNEVAGLLITFAGASSLKSFVSDILAGDAATSRLSRNLEMSTNRLHAWQEAVKTVGGASGNADSSLSRIVDLHANAVLRGDYSQQANLSALGMDYGDLADPSNALLKMATASERMSKIKFVNILTALGIDKNTINLLELGRRDLEKLLAQKERDAALTAEQGKSAEELQTKLAELSTQIQGAVRPALYELVDGLLKTGDAATFVKGAVDILTGSLRGLTSIGDSISAIGLRADMYYSGMRARTAPTPQLKQYYLDRASEDAQKLQGIAERNDARYGRGAGTYRPGTFGRPSDADLARIAPGSGGAVGGQFAVLEAAYGKERARGIWAGIGAESGWDPNAFNKTGGGQGAYGLGQWRGARLKALRSRYGNAPTAAQQIEFLMSELNGGDPGGSAVLGQSSADHALLAYVYKFMRPGGAGALGDMARGRAILGGRPARGASAGRSVSQSTTVGQITIVVPNGDPDTIAKGVRGALAKHEIVNQANSGMTP